MGVHGLWELLAPVGRRVSVETLAGKKLAIDASIWMVQFMKAMRDDNGEMVKNAHLLGFFRRICKLLFLRTKPVFVFDGATPALKRRTVIARRRQRENAQTKIRKTAEKLLLNHLKTMKLKDVANNLENLKPNKDPKGKKILSNVVGMKEDNPGSSDIIAMRKLDEMLAASLAAEDKDFGTTSTSGGGMPYSDEDEDEDEKIIIPSMHGNVDPDVLASLPPSMQLDLLAEMRERLMAENRQRYQKVKKAPSKFSELQIQSYLKTVAFRREINEVQKASSGRSVGGARVSRIASEANREFIFSSSFSGDKQELTSVGVEENDDKQYQKTPENPSTNFLKNIKSAYHGTESRSVVDEPQSSSVDDVETYLDERGRVRVSRVRAMGIRMTRDLQRNLELMNEIEREKTSSRSNVSSVTTSEKQKEILSVGKFADGVSETVSIQDDIHSQHSMSKDGIPLEISFSEDAQNKVVGDDDDDIFARLVASSNPVNLPSFDEKFALDSASDCDWEEGTVEYKCENADSNFEMDTGKLAEAINSDWEEGNVEYKCGNIGSGFEVDTGKVPETINSSECDIQTDCNMAVSEGNLELEADIQEAIKRSFEDRNNNKKSVEHLTKDSEPSHQDIVINKTLVPDISARESVPPVEPKEFGFTGEKHLDTLYVGNDHNIHGPNKIVSVSHSQGESSMKWGTYDINGEEKIVEEISAGNSFEGVFKPVNEESKNVEIDVAEATLEEEILILDEENKILGDEQRKHERNAESVSSEMFAECQELLQMFGLPYIIAPMEAEAQCAFMELTKLVDGVVTDDSDVFLFGARSVYKNIFDDRKYVEMYFMKDIETELGLSREKIINMALLLGSDYTEGVSGVGIVNAIEILNAFPEEDGLLKFRKWVESPDPAILGKVNVQKSSRKKGSEVGDKDNSSKRGASSIEENVSKNGDTQSCNDDDMQNLKQTFMEKHRNVSKNWNVPSSFPNEVVVSAYVCPQVDKSTEAFTWGRPDLSVLRKMCWERFGWGRQKADELLLPVLKEYNKLETQLRLEAFYTFNERFAKIRSKRIHKAVKGITHNRSLELAGDDVSEEPKTRKKKRASGGKSVVDAIEDHNAITGNGEVLKKTAKQGRKGSMERHEEDQNSLELCEVRRSKRFRKSVDYTENELDSEIGRMDQKGCGRDENGVSFGGDGSQIGTECGDLDGDVRISEDYLNVGGGFCDEGVCGERIRTVDSGRMGADLSFHDEIERHDMEDDGTQRKAGEGFIRAMPFLRKKRKV